MFSLRFQREVLDRLDSIRKLLLKALFKPVVAFDIIGEVMNINAGQSTVLTAVPEDAAQNPTTLPAGDVPSWSVSDGSKVTALPSADGLSLSVTVLPSATPGDIIFTITDGQIPSAQGSITLTIPVPSPAPVASFSVTASTPV